MSHSSETTATGNYILIDKSTGSTLSVYLTSTIKKSIDGEEKLFDTDLKAEVESGEWGFHSQDGGLTWFISIHWALSYLGKDTSRDKIELVNGTSWIEGNSSSVIKLKNITLFPVEASVCIGIQNNQWSTVYVLKGKINAQVWSTTISLGAGKKITILNSEVKMPGLNLDDKIEIIDDSIRADDFFIRHGGNDLLQSIKNIPNVTSTGKIISNTGTIIGTIGTSDQDLQIMSPAHESISSKNTFDVSGVIKNSSVSKVTINNKEASVSPVDGTFVYKDFRIDNEINDIIYKGYDTSNNLISKWFITVYASAKSIENMQKPMVTSYPINDKLFSIVAPKENPYKTTENIVRIEGIVPIDTVKSITINDFKLTKFRPLSTDWYYFANKDYNTMNEGINLYKIRYYDANDKMISEQLFTIVKETPESATPQ